MSDSEYRLIVQLERQVERLQEELDSIRYWLEANTSYPHTEYRE